MPIVFLALYSPLCYTSADLKMYPSLQALDPEVTTKEEKHNVSLRAGCKISKIFYNEYKDIMTTGRGTESVELDSQATWQCT